MPTSTANPIQPILDLLTPIITPDWGALIGLIPIALLLVVILWLALTLRAFATAGPTRRAPARVAPVAPASVHMPGGSSAPILAAVGAAALFAGLIIGGLALLVGASILIVTLLAWGREALRDYEHLEPAPSLPAVVHPGPPPGVHMPGPSIRPLLGALGTAALLGGLVVGGWLLLVAVVFLVWTLVGWLVDFSAEYRKVEEADRTGHLENIPARGWPMTALQGFAAVFVIVAVAQTGLLGSIGGAAAPSASPAASGGAGGGGPTGDLSVVAKDIAFDTHSLSIGGGKAFTIAFQNQDAAGIPHNIQIRGSDGSVVQDQPTIDGGKSTVYQFQPLQPGTYTFICKVHPIPGMTGTLTVK
ncbi:MAG TPA: cupredoxin domain-containing protein [Candidatus Limnocylindrales bacterium]|nr:cupredoxin domain-containing protein [Candidatus Limnocylindrales bacterium]